MLKSVVIRLMQGVYSRKQSMLSKIRGIVERRVGVREEGKNFIIEQETILTLREVLKIQNRVMGIINNFKE